jgi:hypothetical protein
MFSPAVFSVQLRFSGFSCVLVVCCSCSNASADIAFAIFRENGVKGWCNSGFTSFPPNILFIFWALSPYIAAHTTPFLTLRDICTVYRPTSPSLWRAPLNFTNTYSHCSPYTSSYSNISKYTLPAIVASVKKKGQIILSFLKTHQNFTSGLTLSPLGICDGTRVQRPLWYVVLLRRSHFLFRTATAHKIQSYNFEVM